MNSKKLRLFFIAFCLCWIVGITPSYGETLKGVEILKGIWQGYSIEYLDGEILVGLKADKTQQDFTNEVGSLPVEIVRLADRFGFLKLRVIGKHDLFGLIDQVGRLPSVRYAEPNMVGHLCLISVIPNDPDFNKQWHYHNTGQVPPGGTPDADIDAPEGWEWTTGSSLIKVGVLDTGIPIQGGTLSHPDLDDATRFLLGYDFVNDDNMPADDHGHGTHVTGTIAAETDNNEGVAGVCWNCRILAIKVASQFGSISAEDFRDGCHYAVDNDCQVINFSGGFYSSSSTLEDGVAYADTDNVLLCAAAGNADGGAVLWPAAYSPQYSNVICVSATDHNDQFASYSSQGPEVNVSAPGGYGWPYDVDDVYSTYLPTGYGYMAGTSMACPHVAGLAALILNQNPSLTPAQTRTWIQLTADDLGPPGFDNQYGWGRINLFKAVAIVGACCLPGGGCVDSLTQAECEALEGYYMGHGTTCDMVQCPTLTQWGLIILVVLIVFSTWVVLRRRKAVVS